MWLGDEAKNKIRKLGRKVGVTVDMLVSNGVWTNVAYQPGNISHVRLLISALMLFSTSEN